MCLTAKAVETVWLPEDPIGYGKTFNVMNQRLKGVLWPGMDETIIAELSRSRNPPPKRPSFESWIIDLSMFESPLAEKKAKFVHGAGRGLVLVFPKEISSEDVK